MARRDKRIGGFSLSAPPFVAPALAAANNGAGIRCSNCRATLDAGTARLRAISFEPRRPGKPPQGTVASTCEFECSRCGGEVTIALHFHDHVQLSALALAVRSSALIKESSDAP